ncbi:MAG TPA: hypothetical protein VMV74_11845 [Bacteroidales bacterium]|nr:hypothetical protein [Bacteroidales bacterium]
MKQILAIATLAILNNAIYAIQEQDLALAQTAFQDHITATSDTIGKSSVLIKPFQLDIVAPSSGVQFYRNGIIFLSNSKGETRVPEKHLSFGSLKTFMSLVSDTVPGPYMPFMTGSSNIFPSEASTFSGDYNTMYLSLIQGRDNKEKIFSATYGQDGWVIDSRPMSFCSNDYIYTHPALSKDGKFMIFSSDMTGSAGGLDLFISKRENDKWSEPENLGNLINTTGNELFASFDAENNLYFSSDGLPGEGGYDIYVSRYNGSTWGKPENLTSLINSQNDEVAFTINPSDGKSAFFTSMAKSVKNKTQLYRIIPKSDLLSDRTSSLTSSFLAITGLKIETQPDAQAITASTVTVKPETKPEPQKTTSAEKAITPQPQPKPAEAKPEPTKTTPTPEVKNDIVVYRVQILANTKPVGSYNLTVAGKSYKTFEYLYAGGYRTTVGEFSTLTEATKFQNTCRQSGYNQAFVVAFKNDVRSNDPELLKS